MAHHPAGRLHTTIIATASALALAVCAAPVVHADPAGPTATITGRLLTPDGLPAAGFTVVACTAADDCLVGTERADESAVDGTFMLDDVVVGTVLLDILTLPEDSGQDELMWLEPLTLEVAEDGEDLGDLELAPTPIVTGTIVDQFGPVQGATVTFGDIWYAPTTTTGADGTFTIRPQAIGVETLSVTTGTHTSRSLPIDLQPGTVRDIRSLNLEVVRRISGVVRNSAGHTVSQTFIEIWDPKTSSYPVWQGYTARDGTFRADGLPFGTYTISAHSEKTYILKPMTVTLSAANPQTSATITAMVPAGLYVRLVTSNGVAVKDALPEVEQLVGGQWKPVGHLWHSDDGTYLSERRLFPGTYRANIGDAFFDQEIIAPRALTEGALANSGTAVVRRYTTTDKHTPVVSAPTTSHGTTTYDPDRWVRIEANVSGLKPGGDRTSLGAALVDADGNIITSASFTGSILTAYLPRQDVGTHVVKFVIDGDVYHHRAASAPITVTVKRAATSLTTARLTKSTARWGQSVVAIATNRGVPGARTQLLVNGKVAYTTAASDEGTLRTSELRLSLGNLPVGTHTIAIRTLATTHYAGATSRPVKITITRGRLNGRPVVKASTIKRGSKPRVVVTIPRADGGLIRFGKVRIYVNGKAVRTVKVTAKTGGRIVVTLPVKPRATFKVRATYVSNSKYVGATSKTIKVKVRR